MLQRQSEYRLYGKESKMMLNILCVANPIKEVLSGQECLQALVSGVKNVHGQDAERKPGLLTFLMSDGGDGFLDAVGREQGFERVEIETTGPLSAVISVPILWDAANEVAYIESALCCGLNGVEPERRDIMMSGTAGLADLLMGARELGVKEIVIGLGGSATCDGGLGLLWRLACLTGQFHYNACAARGAIDLAESPSPDMKALQKWWGDVRIRVCVDVDNPLLGDNGAARVFAPQKGADAEQAEQLEAWMELWCDRVERNVGEVVRDEAGAGAAGGLGFALRAMGAELVPGAETIAELIGLKEAVGQNTLLLTTEGKFDATSLGGKAPWVAAQLALQAQGSAAIFCGVADEETAGRARENRVRVIEYGRDMDVSALSAETPGRLSGAVHDYLSNLKGVGLNAKA